jgi:hypothetical protein
MRSSHSGIQSAKIRSMLTDSFVTAARCEALSAAAFRSKLSSLAKWTVSVAHGIEIVSA